MRLSMDLRYQRRGEVATGHTVRPHLGHAAWDTVYAGWPERCLPEGGGAVRSAAPAAVKSSSADLHRHVLNPIYSCGARVERPCPPQ
jgi:hypothetical protein